MGVADLILRLAVPDWRESEARVDRITRDAQVTREMHFGARCCLVVHVGVLAGTTAKRGFLSGRGTWSNSRVWVRLKLDPGHSRTSAFSRYSQSSRLDGFSGRAAKAVSRNACTTSANVAAERLVSSFADLPRNCVRRQLAVSRLLVLRDRVMSLRPCRTRA
jgi:hypothetical protein